MLFLIVVLSRPRSLKTLRSMNVSIKRRQPLSVILYWFTKKLTIIRIDFGTKNIFLKISAIFTSVSRFSNWKHFSTWNLLQIDVRCWCLFWLGGWGFEQAWTTLVGIRWHETKFSKNDKKWERLERFVNVLKYTLPLLDTRWVFTVHWRTKSFATTTRFFKTQRIRGALTFGNPSPHPSQSKSQKTN